MRSAPRLPAAMRPAAAVSLDRGSKVPLHAQITARVRGMLARARPPDGRVFTEHELARRFGVSRMTVRQALGQLVDEGLLYRVRGVGTLLTSTKVTESLERVRDHFEDWEAEGRSVSLKILDFRRVEAGVDVARRLGLPERTEVLHLTRVWIVDGVPIGLVYLYIHPSAAVLSVSDVEHSHVRHAVARRLRIPFLGEQVEIEAGQASRVMAAHLQIPPGAPVLIRRVTQFYGDHRPLVAANGYYRGDLYRYAVYVPASPAADRTPTHSLRGEPVTMRAIAARPAPPRPEGRKDGGRPAAFGEAPPGRRRAAAPAPPRLAGRAVHAGGRSPRRPR